jgi:hypothetical protein
MRCSRTPPSTRARPRKAEAREGIARYNVDDEDDVTSDVNFVLLLVLGKNIRVKSTFDFW